MPGEKSVNELKCFAHPQRKATYIISFGGKLAHKEVPACDQCAAELLGQKAKGIAPADAYARKL